MADFRSFLGRVFQPGPTPITAPLPATGRAGRNLPAAFGTAAVLISILLLTLFFTGTGFTLFVAALTLACVWELAGAFARVGIKIAVPPIYVGTAGIITCAWLLGPEATFVSLYISIFAIVLWVLADSQRDRRMNDIIASIFTVVYIPFFASFIIMMLRELGNPLLVLFAITLIVANDLGGWGAGISFGKHPMAPRLSPKKSWEGFAGSMALCMAVGMAGLQLLGFTWWWGLPLGLAACVIGTMGDLLESLIKREVGLKDMSQLLPGHGGALDRIDALLLFAPVFYFIIRTALGA